MYSTGEEWERILKEANAIYSKNVNKPLHPPFLLPSSFFILIFLANFFTFLFFSLHFFFPFPFVSSSSGHLPISFRLELCQISLLHFFFIPFTSKPQKSPPSLPSATKQCLQQRYQRKPEGEEFERKTKRAMTYTRLAEPVSGLDYSAPPPHP